MPAKRSRFVESVQPEADGSPQVPTHHHNLFYFVGSTRDPIHDILNPPSSQASSYPTPAKTPVAKKKTKKPLPEGAESDEENVELESRPSFNGEGPRLVLPTSRPPQRNVLSLYSITQGKLAINMVSGKKNVRKLEEVLYPGAIVTFPLPPPPPSASSSSSHLKKQQHYRRTFELPSFVQTLIPAPSNHDEDDASSSSSSSSSVSTSSSVFTNPNRTSNYLNPLTRTTSASTTASTVLATLEFPKDVELRPVVLNERDERARGFREVVEARICMHEESEKGMEGFASDDEQDASMRDE